MASICIQNLDLMRTTSHISQAQNSTKENALPSFFRTDIALSIKCRILTTNLFKLGVDIVSQNQPTTSEEAPESCIDSQRLATMDEGDSKARFSPKHPELTESPH